MSACPVRLRTPTRELSLAAGPPDTREVAGLRVAKVTVGDFDNNVYLLRCPSTGDQLLIDAANEPDRLLELVGPAGLSTVVTSHRHWDHVQALEAVTSATGAEGVAHHAADADELPGHPAAGSSRDGDEVSVGQARLRRHPPRRPYRRLHRAALRAGDRRRGATHLFTGDCLFPGGPGNTEKDPERFASLMDDLERKVFGPLPDETWIYPGHGKDTTLGVERPHLDEWRQRGW